MLNFSPPIVRNSENLFRISGSMDNLSPSIVRNSEIMFRISSSGAKNVPNSAQKYAGGARFGGV